MSDRELLELAAKAAGIEVMRSRLDDPMQQDMLVRQSARNAHHNNGPWNPLTDDGDALRLAVKLGMFNEGMPNAVRLQWELSQRGDPDPYADTRRAIVRAAAEIGRQV
ncbi:MAG: hypothetical protein ACK5PF_08785 [bacterium]|jgi:hypothetical protein